MVPTEVGKKALLQPPPVDAPPGWDVATDGLLVFPEGVPAELCAQAAKSAKSSKLLRIIGGC